MPKIRACIFLYRAVQRRRGQLESAKHFHMVWMNLGESFVKKKCSEGLEVGILSLYLKGFLIPQEPFQTKFQTFLAHHPLNYDPVDITRTCSDVTVVSAHVGTPSSCTRAVLRVASAQGKNGPKPSRVRATVSLSRTNHIMHDTSLTWGGPWCSSPCLPVHFGI